MSDPLAPRELDTINELKNGGRPAQVLYFEQNRDALKQMTRYRIDRRLARRLDDSDVLQEAFIEYCNRVERYLDEPVIPPLIWLRRLVRQVISRLNRDHVGAQCRDLRRETYALSTSGVNLEMLSQSLSSISNRINQIELRERLRNVVAKMSPIEREIVSLVHFEERTIRDAAIEIGIGIEAAKKRYRRALGRLREINEPKLQVFVE